MILKMEGNAWHVTDDGFTPLGAIPLKSVAGSVIQGLLGMNEAMSTEFGKHLYDLEIRIPQEVPDRHMSAPAVMRVLDVTECAACGADHAGMAFNLQPYADYQDDWWAGVCPETAINIWLKEG